MNSTSDLPKVCLICARPAIGFHYDVVACKGCKTFFRRMHLSKLNVECQLQKKCFDTTRKEPYFRCRPCRYQKCLDVGMNASAIQISVSEPSCVQRPVEAGKMKIRSVNADEDKMRNLVKSLSHLESSLEDFRQSLYTSACGELYCLEKMIKSANGLSTTKKLELSPSSTMSGVAARHMDHAIAKNHGLCLSWATLEYIKTFDFFSQLDSRDQYLLARYVILTCANFHASHFSVSRKLDIPLKPDGEIEIARFYSPAMLVIPILVRIQIQPIEYLLLKVICICNPAVPDLSPYAQKVLSDERSRTVRVLLDYCLRSAGPARFGELLTILEVLEKQQSIQRDLYILRVLQPNALKYKLKFLYEIMTLESY